MTDLTVAVSAIQIIQQVLTRIENILSNGVAITSTLPTYTFASLPVTAANGQLAFGSNVRKPGEGGGAGTGMTIFFNSATGTWFTTLGVAATV